MEIKIGDQNKNLNPHKYLHFINYKSNQALILFIWGGISDPGKKNKALKGEKKEGKT